MEKMELYSKRQKRLRGEVAGVYTYDEIPHALRIQVILWLRKHIAQPTSGLLQHPDFTGNRMDPKYQRILETLQAEYALLPLSAGASKMSYYAELEGFLKEEPCADRILDVIQLAAREIMESDPPQKRRKKVDGFEARALGYGELAKRAIEELNVRFLENGVGYQIENGSIVRIDSQIIHVEAVKPALALLNEKEYWGAQEEFLAAYDHFRHGRHKESLVDANKAIESTIKIICGKRSWPFSPTDTTKKLFHICFENGLVPKFWESQLSGLRVLLEGSVPTARNKLGGHGQGATCVEVSASLVAYVLHMTAATIVFLVKAEQEFVPESD